MQLVSDVLVPDSTLYKLIELLADGQWHSGEELGGVLGISRAAVAKQLKQLSDLGLSTEVIKGTGYRLTMPIELLNEQSILSAMDHDTQSRLSALRLFGSIDSTNHFLMERLRQKQVVHSVVCLAERQTAGRGRRGREWHSPFAQNIYMSVGWHFDGGVAKLGGLSLAVGVVICKTIEAFGVCGVGLKWPNDILCKGKKVGGVLVELGGDAVSDCVAVIGIGLNVQMRSFDTDIIDQPWCSLYDIGFRGSRNALSAVLIDNLLTLLDSYGATGFASYADDWNHLDVFAGQEVELTSASHVQRGKMCGVTADGALILESDTGRETFVGGELSLRLKM